MRQSIAMALAMGLVIAGCSSDEAAKPPENPRLAKSGKKLTDEPEIPIANDSPEPVEAKVSSTTSTAETNAAASSGETPPLSQAQLQALGRRALAGDANAQVELGNAYFEGKGVPLNKQVAERLWRQAAAQRHPAAIANLQMLHTDPEDGVSFFGTVAKGKRFVFIIDKSGSMTGRNFRKAKAEINRTLKSLPPDARFMIYFFSFNTEKLPANAMMAAVPKNVDWATRWVSGRSPGGDTRPADAIRFAFQDKPDTIWLLTDGHMEGDVPGQIRRANPVKKIRVNTLCFPGGDDKVLKKIAAENGGTYRFVQN